MWDRVGGKGPSARTWSAGPPWGRSRPVANPACAPPDKGGGVAQTVTTPHRWSNTLRGRSNTPHGWSNTPHGRSNVTPDSGVQSPQMFQIAKLCVWKYRSDAPQRGLAPSVVPNDRGSRVRPIRRGDKQRSNQRRHWVTSFTPVWKTLLACRGPGTWNLSTRELLPKLALLSGKLCRLLIEICPKPLEPPSPPSLSGKIDFSHLRTSPKYAI